MSKSKEFLILGNIWKGGKIAPNVSGVCDGGVFTTNVYAEHKTFGYHKAVCEARNPAFWVGAVMGWRFHRVVNEISFPSARACRTAS
jgi:hypothetical protein